MAQFNDLFGADRDIVQEIDGADAGNVLRVAANGTELEGFPLTTGLQSSHIPYWNGDGLSNSIINMEFFNQNTLTIAITDTDSIALQINAWLVVGGNNSLFVVLPEATTLDGNDAILPDGRRLIMGESYAVYVNGIEFSLQVSSFGLAPALNGTSGTVGTYVSSNGLTATTVVALFSTTTANRVEIAAQAAGTSDTGGQLFDAGIGGGTSAALFTQGMVQIGSAIQINADLVVGGRYLGEIDQANRALSIQATRMSDTTSASILTLTAVIVPSGESIATRMDNVLSFEEE